MSRAQPQPQSAVSNSCQPASAASAMSDLNSAEKPRSEPSLGGSQPHSWSDVTLIEDITQDSLHRSLSAHGLGEYIPSSSESEVDQPSPAAPQDQPQPPKLPAQAVCVVKRFRLRSRSRGPALPVAPASDSTQLEHAPSMSDKPRLLPLSVVPRPSTGLPVPEPPAARRPTPPWSVNSTKRPRMVWNLQPSSQQVHHVSFRPRMPQPPSKGGLQPSFFAPPPRWSQHMLGVAVPKPRPLTRPPPRSLVYKPPAPPRSDPVQPLGIFTATCLHISLPLPRVSPVTPLNHPHLRRARRASSPEPPRRRLVKTPAFQRGRKSSTLWGLPQAFT